MPPNVNVNFEIDTRGGHCQRFVTSLVVLLCPTESVMSEGTVRRGLQFLSLSVLIQEADMSCENIVCKIVFF